MRGGKAGPSKDTHRLLPVAVVAVVLFGVHVGWLLYFAPIFSLFKIYGLEYAFMECLTFEVIVEIDRRLMDRASKLIRATCGKMWASSCPRVCLPLPGVPPAFLWPPLHMTWPNRRTNTRRHTHELWVNKVGSSNGSHRRSEGLMPRGQVIDTRAPPGVASRLGHVN